MDNDTICDGELVFTIDFGLMYSVANLDNDDDSIKVFVYNNAGRGEQDSQYGKFFVITAEDCFLITNDGFQPCSTNDAFAFVSKRPEYYSNKYEKWLQETDFDRFDETDFLSLNNV